jgi:choline dehydrogenase-like flavoprotein/alpha-beta hydrolase superfamily lysophospholipase
MARAEWLLEGAEKLAFAGPDADGFHCDIAIVGSGYGGAVAAARLAGRLEENGSESRVWVLERGNEFTPGDFPERFADLIGEARVTWGDEPQLSGRAQGLFDLRLGADVSALMGNGLGGGSLINAGVLARPHASVFRPPWPAQINSHTLDKAFNDAEVMLGGDKLRGTPPPKLRALEALGTVIDGRRDNRRATVAVSFVEGHTPAGVQQRKCIGCGDCFTGCNHGAKNTLPTNYLASARRRGARLFTGITVLSLSGRDEAWDIDFRFTDRQVAKRFGAVPPKLRAKRVILAAGTYGSTGILLRSHAEGFTKLSRRQLGRRFSTNGDMIAAAYGMPQRIHAGAREETPPGDRQVGPTIAGMIDLRDRRVPLAIEELAVPAALRRVFEEVVTTLGVLHGLTRRDRPHHRATGHGADPAAVDQDLMARTAVYATMGDDGAAGTLELAAGRPADPHLRLDGDVCVSWSDVGEHEVFAEAMRLLDEAHAGSGAFVMANPLWRALPAAIGAVLDDGPSAGSVFTVHPLGGCAMAESGSEGVVNRLGQVFRGGEGRKVHKTLVVLDGAIVPTALGINPCLTIAALAEHAVGELGGEWHLGAQKPEGSLPDMPAERRQVPWPERMPTGIRLAERLEGPLRLAVEDASGSYTRDFKAQLEIEYREIADLEAFLAARTKSMPIARARLHLHGSLRDGGTGSGLIDWQGVAELEGELRPFDREEAGSWRRILRAAFAWLCNRGARELLALLWHGLNAPCRAIGRWYRGEPSPPPGRPSLERLGDWIAIASHAGEARLLSYDFVVMRDVRPSPGAVPLLCAGDRLRGMKRIAYVPALPWVRRLLRWPWLRRLEDSWPSPWDQLTRLPLTLWRRGGRPGLPVGTLLVELPYFVKQFATQLQVTQQENQPRAIADLLSFAAFLLRMVGKIHIWSFRAPDYPDPYPCYEFAFAERRAAARAAREVKLRVESRRRHRLPGPVEGLDHSVVKRPRFRLTRYERTWVPKNEPPRQPVLLIHGLGASGNTFTFPTLKRPLVKHLVDNGFDPWVLDLRTSVGLKDSKCDWTFEQAGWDIRAALRMVRKHYKEKHKAKDVRIDVVAHCIGAAMFSMAALAGRLKDRATGADMVRKAVLSQAGPLMELPPANRFRGYLASYFKHYLQIDEFDTTASLTPFNRFIDRVLAAYPYPREEWGAHLSLLPVTHEAYCLRTYGIYGRLFEHGNLAHATLERLGDMIGHVRYKTYQQTIFFATMRRLTDPSGRNAYVTAENIEKHLRFPICFLHGAKNEVFDRRSARRSFDLVASVFWWKELEDVWTKDPARRYDYGAYAGGRRLRIVEVEGYGHQDCLIGRRAHIDVYPHVVDFLKAEIDPAEKPRNDKPVFVVRPPRLGPVLGWLRPAPGGGCLARVILVPNDSRSTPLYGLTFLVRKGQGNTSMPVDGSGRFHALQGEAEGPPVRRLDVHVPDLEDASLVVLTVHHELYESELARDTGEPALDDPFGEDIDHVLGSIQGMPRTAAAAAALSGGDIDGLLRNPSFLARVFEGCRDFGVGGMPLGAGRRVSERRYASPVSAAILERPVLEAGASQEGNGKLRFALASCRYASNVTDRELADRKFGRLRNLLESSDPERGKPQLLFLAGDTIYADATYGVFDPTLGTERYDQRYVEAWTAPNALEVLRRLPVYPMLDDHEVEENFEGVPTGEEATAGLRAFEAFQMMLTPRAAPAPGRYWYELRAGGFDFFVADTRTGRLRRNGAGGLDPTIGDPLMAALRAWLLKADQAGPHKPKFIVSPSVVAPWSKETRGHDAYALRSDAWDGFPYSTHGLLAFIAHNGIRNVVFLSGDYHCSLYCPIELTWGARTVRAHSIVASGLYSPYPFANTRIEDLEMDFAGSHRSRFAGGVAPCCDRLGSLEIRYEAQPMASCASFALVGVEPRGDEAWMTVAFDEGQAPVDVRLS